jgi:methyl-accepting chemotaxis protein
MARKSSTSGGNSGLFSFCDNCKISTKIFAGFSLLLVILAAVSYGGYHTFGTVTEKFLAYAQREEVAGIARSVDREFINLRRQVREFASTGSEKNVQAAGKQRELLREAISGGLQKIHNPERHQKMQEISGQVDAYLASFEKVVPAKREQLKLTAETLDPAGRKMRQDAAAMQAAAVSEGNAAVIALAGSVMEQVMAARLNVNKMLVRHEEAAAGMAEGAFSALGRLLPEIETATSDSGVRNMAADIRKLADVYSQGYHRASKLGSELEKLAFVEMPKLADDTVADIEVIKSGAIAEAASLEKEALELMESSARLILILAIGGMVLGMGLAYYIGSSIGTPIRQIGVVLMELASGNKNVEVPFAHRRDEVGDNARAAKTFKENLLQIERMESERKEAERIAAAERKAGMLKLADGFQAAVGEIIDTVSSASTQLEASAQGLTHTASHTQELATTVASASEEASMNVQSVASATEELSGSVGEISRQVNESSRIANEAVQQAQQTDERMNELSRAATCIGDVMKLITAIAEQTNLLALNATIEAARAGEAGKGFAVVAQEVKTLAAQTAKATEEVGSQIGGIQNATRESVSAIKQIDATIHRISEIASMVASAAAEQGAATQEIARNVNQAAQGTHLVAQSIGEVNKGASETGSASSQVLTAAKSMAAESNRLKIEVDRFLAGVRAA